MSESGEITFTLKFSGEDMDVLDVVAGVLNISRDELLQEKVAPPIQQFVGDLIVKLRETLPLIQNHAARRGLLSLALATKKQ